MTDKIKITLLISLLTINFACGNSSGAGSPSTPAPAPIGGGPVPTMNLQRTDTNANIPNGSGPYTFGGAVHGTNGRTIQFRIQNIGGASLRLTNTGPNYVTLSGADPGSFSVTIQPSGNTIG